MFASSHVYIIQVEKKLWSSIQKLLVTFNKKFS